MFEKEDKSIIKLIVADKICRICLQNNGPFRDIHRAHISDMVQKCANVYISQNDGLSNKICRICLSLLNKYHKFKMKIESSDSMLRKYMNTVLNKDQYDILNIALNEADIQSIADTSNIHQNSTILLSSDFNVEDPNMDGKVSVLNNIKYDDNVHFIDNGPPPLVPFEQYTYKLNDTVDIRVPDLPKDTPPLLPLKNLSSIDMLERLEIKTSQYQCFKCSEQFSSVLTLKKHKLSVCQVDILQCNICHKKFTESRKLIGHLKRHMVTKDYKCEICFKDYPNPSTLTVHMRTHTGERPFKCNLCCKGFARWAGLVGHMKVHASEKSHICDTCGRCFKNGSNLTRHKRRHTKDSPYLCSFCDKAFNQSDNLQVHIIMNHTNEKQFLCSKCGKSFVNSTRLKRHMWVHSGFKPHSCKTCQKQYSNLGDLRNHETRAHFGRNPDEYKKYCCDKCDMRFFHPSRLARHKKSHGKSYECQVCSQTFLEEDTLLKHTQDKHQLNYLVNRNDNLKILVEFQHEENRSKIAND